MSLRRALYLRDFNQRFVFCTLPRILIVDRGPLVIRQGKGRAPRDIGVMRDSKTINATGSEFTHPVPQFFGILAIQPRKKLLGQALCAPKNHVTMKVSIVKLDARGVLIASESCKSPGLVSLICRLNRALPDGSAHAIYEHLINRAIL